MSAMAVARVGLLAIFLSSVLFAAMAHSGTDPSKLKPEDIRALRLARADQTVTEVLAEPDRQVFVTVSLRRLVNVDELRVPLAVVPGRLIETWHVFVGQNNVFTGGYLLSPAETISGAAASYSSTFREQLEAQLSDLRSMPEAMSDPALARLIADLDRRLAVLRQEGVSIYGFAFRGRARDIVPFAQALPFDKVVEASVDRVAMEPLPLYGGGR